MTTLANALPELVAAEDRLRKLAAAQGITYRIADFGGVRTLADTTKILGYRETEYAAARKAGDAKALALSINDWRPIAPFGNSWHNYGAAFDVRPTQWPATMQPLDAMNALRALAPRAGLRVLNSKDDPWHFELPIPLDEARRRWNTTTRRAWPVIGGPGEQTFVVIGVVGLLIAAVVYFGNQAKKPKRGRA